MTVTPPPELEEASEASELDLELELELLIKEARARARRRRLAVAAAALMVLAGIGAVLAGGGGGAAILAGVADAGGGGAAGARADAGVAAAALVLRDAVTAFAFDPRPPATMYVGTRRGDAYRSSDAGRHWARMAVPSRTLLRSFATDPQRPQRLYAGTGEAVSWTVDGGRSWTAGRRGLLGGFGGFRSFDSRYSQGWVDELAVDPSDGTIYAGTHGGGVRKSSDGGRSWTTVLFRGRGTYVNALAVAPTSPPTVYAAVDTFGCANPCKEGRHIYKTTDAGKTWRPIADMPALALAVDPQDPTTLYAGVSTVVYDTGVLVSDVLRSTDAGVHWTSITDGLPAAKHGLELLAVDPRRPGTVYAGVRDDPSGYYDPWGSYSTIFQTADGGLNWDRLTVGFPVTTLAVDPAHPARLFAAVVLERPTVGFPTIGIVRSEDNGQTWSR